MSDELELAKEFQQRINELEKHKKERWGEIIIAIAFLPLVLVYYCFPFILCGILIYQSAPWIHEYLDGITHIVRIEIIRTK